MIDSGPTKLLKLKQGKYKTLLILRFRQLEIWTKRTCWTYACQKMLENRLVHSWKTWFGNQFPTNKNMKGHFCTFQESMTGTGHAPIANANSGFFVSITPATQYECAGAICPQHHCFLNRNNFQEVATSLIVKKLSILILPQMSRS